jgi:hypothetical protein
MTQDVTIMMIRIKHGFSSAALALLASVAAPVSVAAQSISPQSLPETLPAPGTPEYGALVEKYGGQLLDSTRQAYRDCVATQFYAFAVANAPGGDAKAFTVPDQLAERDKMTETVIAKCADTKAKLFAPMDAEVAKRAPFNGALKRMVDIVRSDLVSFDDEFRQNIRNLPPRTKK